MSSTCCSRRRFPGGSSIIFVATALLSFSWVGLGSCSAFVLLPHLMTRSTAAAVALSGYKGPVEMDHGDDDDWNDQYGRVLQFYQRFGHVRFEKEYFKDRSNVQALILSRWVQRQRLEMYNFPERVSPDRRTKLAAVGMKMHEPSEKEEEETDRFPIPPLFVTDLDTNRKIYASAWEQRWEDMFEELVSFKQTHGIANCNTRQGYRTNRRLADWVQIQRENLHLGAVRSDRRDKLQGVGVTPLVMGGGGNMTFLP